MSDSNATILDDVIEMAEWYGAHQDLLPAGAGEQFMRLVEPCEIPNATLEQTGRFINLACTEWILFECAGEDGRVPLRAYADDNPQGLDAATISRLRTVADTQFFSHFAILDKNPDTGACLLLDSVHGGTYIVLSETLSRMSDWDDGRVGVRIARDADAVWSAVGQTYLYDRGRAVLSGLDTDPGQGVATEEGSPFIDALIDAIGMHGRMVEVTRLRQ